MENVIKHILIERFNRFTVKFSNFRSEFKTLQFTQVTEINVKDMAASHFCKRNELTITEFILHAVCHDNVDIRYYY